jgi:hypothetical protein
MSISSSQLEEIKIKYGHMSSFAIWEEKGKKEKSNVGDLSVFENPINTLFNPTYVFVGLNISQKIAEAFGNFHSSSSTSHDYKIRYALKDTILGVIYDRYNKRF